MASQCARQRTCLLLIGIVGAIACADGCKSPRPVTLPPVPMADLDPRHAAPTQQASRLPRGACVPPESLGPMPGDTLEPEPLASPPRLVSMPEVRYPASERQQGWEGELSVRLLVLPNGRVGRVDVGDGQDPFLLAAADAACGARFIPAQAASGRSVHAWVTHTFSFRLGIEIPASAPRAR